jgi:hypothetical protein
LLKNALKSLIRNKWVSLKALLIAAGVIALYLLCVQTLALPLLGDHCMKTSKSIEISYNMVRYGDPFNQYADWQVTKDNLYGDIGSIVRYESPLSALLLAGLYVVVNSADFMTRVDTARYFTLVHLLGAYFLLVFVIWRRDAFALVVFSVVFIVSTFTVAYSTQPFVESFALLYQALFMVMAVRLLDRPIAPIKKSLIIAALAFLLCVGGKMNYFLIAIPVIIGFPFIDKTFRGLKKKLLFLAVFAVGGGGLLAVLVLFLNFDLEGTLVFMIKGNKPIIGDSLWRTFLEGFDAFDELATRTREDFGSLPYKGGIIGCFYIAARFVYLLIFKRGKPFSRHDSFELVLFLFILGHALNYVVLRNLYIPHRYYVIPLFTIFCLALTALIADLQKALFLPHPLKAKLWYWLTARLSRRFSVFKSGLDPATLQQSSVFVAVIFLSACSTVTAMAAFRFDASRSWRTAFVVTAKSLGSRALSIELVETFTKVLPVLYGVAIAAAVLAVLLVVAARTAKPGRRFSRIVERADGVILRYGIRASSVVVVFFVLMLGGYLTLIMGNSLYSYGESYREHIDNARALAKIREDTRSGDLVLAWKWCIAFYADKRSITDATVKDLPYYREHDIHSVMGPVKPLNHYYQRIEKYADPMSYWRPLSKEELKARRNKKKRSGTK